MIAGIDARPARLFNLATLLNVARIVNRVQTGEYSLPVARRFQGDIAIYGSRNGTISGIDSMM